MSIPFLKKLFFLFVAFLLLWVVYLYHQVPHRAAPFAKASDSAEKILIQKGPLHVELFKQGKEWQVLSDAQASYLADEEGVKTLLTTLKDVQVEEEISNHAERAAEFEVDAASGTHVILQNAKGSSLAEGIFGKQAPDVSHIYFRYPDQPMVYLARGLIRGELGEPKVNAWRSHLLVPIPQAQIQSILIEGKDFKTDLVRTSTNAWTMNGKSVDTGLVNALARTVSHLRADSFVDALAYPDLSVEGLTYARLTVRGPQSTLTLRIGPLDAKAKRHAVSVGKEAGLSWLPQSLVSSLLQKPSAFQTK